MTIPEAMKAMREMTGPTPAEFAARRGVSGRVIQDIERGTGNPPVESLNSVAKLFGLQVGFVPTRRTTGCGFFELVEFVCQPRPDWVSERQVKIG